LGAYHELATCYDRLTDDVDYEAVVEFYDKILEKENLSPRTAVDLACGTGSVALLLAKKGVQVTAVDMSEEMLCVAAQRGQEPGVQFVCQKLEQLQLGRGVDLAVCALDSLDYITEPENCRRAIARVYKALNHGGCFIFDVNTPERLRAMDDQVFLDEDEDVYCVWRGEFDEASNICTYAMDLFQRSGDVRHRSFEEHREYAYSEEQLRQYLRNAGFTNIEVYADREFLPPRQGEQRIYFKARKGKIK
jgi:ubiquinone/menaquinone biosynthesis C-methylase UbiE